MRRSRVSDLKRIAHVCQLKRDIAQHDVVIACDIERQAITKCQSIEAELASDDAGYQRQISGLSFNPDILRAWQTSLVLRLGSLHHANDEVSVAQAKTVQVKSEWGQACSRVDVINAAGLRQKKREARRLDERMLEAVSDRWLAAWGQS